MYIFYLKNLLYTCMTRKQHLFYYIVCFDVPMSIIKLKYVLSLFLQFYDGYSKKKLMFLK